jgi:ABC-2 type transport system ATP-binding protein
MKAIEVDDITKVFGGREVLKNVSFTVEKGSVHGFLGPNGAGKTTTMRVITDLLRPDSGEVRINGVKNCGGLTGTNNSIGFLLEDPPLYKDMLVKEYLTFVGALKKVSSSEIRKNLDYCISALDLSSVYNRSIENLSKGFKQRVGIAQALIHMPEILILDEPTAGLDPQSVVEIRNLILELRNEHTIIISSHLLHEMSLVCDQVTIISEGSIKETGTIKDLRSRLAGKLKIIIKSQNRSDEFSKFLIDFPGILTVDIEETGDEILHYLQYAGGDEIRTVLLEKAFEFNTQPLGLEQSEYSLEEIFLRIIK